MFILIFFGVFSLLFGLTLLVNPIAIVRAGEWIKQFQQEQTNFNKPMGSILIVLSFIILTLIWMK